MDWSNYDTWKTTDTRAEEYAALKLCNKDRDSDEELEELLQKAMCEPDYDADDEFADW